MTNYERIKAMSVEEMAVMFAKLRANLYTLDLPVVAYRGGAVNDNIDWLESEVTHEFD